MALALSRNVGESVVLGVGRLRITLELVGSSAAQSHWRLCLPILGAIDLYIESKDHRAKIAISAPSSLKIRRGELADMPLPNRGMPCRPAILPR